MANETPALGLTPEELEELRILEEEEKRAGATVAPEELEALAAEEDLFQLTPEAPFGQAALEAGETFAKGAAAAATLGASELAFPTIESAVEGYPVEAAIERRRQLKQEYPYVEMAGQTVGGLVGPVAKAGQLASEAVSSGLSALAGTKAAEATGKALGKAAEPLERIVGGALTGAAQAPIVGAQLFAEQAAGIVKPEEAPSFADIAGTTAAYGAAPPLAGLALKGAKAVGSGLMTVVLGPSKEVRKAYLNDPAKVSKMIEEADRRAALPVDAEQPGEAVLRGLPRTQVAEQIIETTAPIREQFKETQQRLKAAQLSEEEAKTSLLTEIEDRKKQIADAVKQQSETAGMAEKRKRDLFRTGLSEEFAGDIKVAAEDLKKDVILKSQQSYAILDKQPGAAQLTGIQSKIFNLVDELKTGGNILGKVKKRTAKLIEDWSEEIGQTVGTSQTVPYRTVKEIVQSIDSDLQYMRAPENRGKFSELDRAYLMRIRRLVDENIKEIPEYAELMEDVSQRNELLENVANFIGDETKVNLVAKLNNIWKPGNPAQDFITRLGRATNRPFEDAIVEYAAMKQTGASQEQMAKALQELPENVVLRGIQQTRSLAERELLEARRALRARRPEGFESELANEQAVAWAKSVEDVNSIRRQLDFLEATLEEVGSAGERDTAINFVSEAMRGLNPRVKNQILALNSLTGVNFEREVRAASTAEALMRPYSQGSARSNVVGGLGRIVGGAVLGGLTPLMSDSSIADKGWGLGGLIGFTLDRYGGRVTKQLLDGYLRIKGIPTVQKINSAFTNLPKPLKAGIVDSFVRAVGNSERQTIAVPDEDLEITAVEIQNSVFLSPLEKARSTMLLKKTSLLDTDVVKKMMLGGLQGDAQEMKVPSFNAIRAKPRERDI